MLFAIALFAGITTTQAQTDLFVNNNTPCGYMVQIYEAPMGGCMPSYSVITIPVPPFFVGPVYTTAPGTWVVGAHFITFGIGLSSPLPGACMLYPSNANFVNTCNFMVNAQYTQGPPIPFSASRLQIW
ncbi:MAG: hypothetical protein JKY48_16150 [Flavobacteriales bacterium]|nr:hypothetical protein [Flavobacteriales bacterium]